MQCRWRLATVAMAMRVLIATSGTSGVIKSAASTAYRKTKSSGPRSRGAPQPAAIRLPSRRPGAFLDLGPLDLVFVVAALAADLIAAPKSIQKRQNMKSPGNDSSKECRTREDEVRGQEKALSLVLGTRSTKHIKDAGLGPLSVRPRNKKNITLIINGKSSFGALE